MSLDVPSGVDAGSGKVYEPSIKATATMTLVLPKTGLGGSDVRARLGDFLPGRPERATGAIPQTGAGSGATVR